MEKLSRVQVFEILFLNLKGEIGDDVAKVQFGFDQRIWLIAQEIAQSTDYEKRLVIKRENRVKDERLKPSEDYRNEERLNLSSLYEAGWTYIDGKMKVTVYSIVDLCRGNPVEPSLLESYLPKLQNYGVPVQIFPFNQELIVKRKVIYESKFTYGTRSYSVSADQVSDSIPVAWYDWDYKVIIRYSKELVVI